MALKLYCWGPESYGSQFAVMAHSKAEAKVYLKAYAVQQDKNNNYQFPTSKPSTWNVDAVSQALSRGCTMLKEGQVYHTEIS